MGSKIVGLPVFDGTLCRGRLQGSSMKTKAVGSGVDDRHHASPTADAEEEGEVGRNFHDELAETYNTVQTSIYH
jgi:hypothetical protein